MPTVQSELRRLRARMLNAQRHPKWPIAANQFFSRARPDQWPGRPRTVEGDTASPGSQRIQAWMARRGWKPWAFQQEAWDAYARPESGLINVPTGAGKTYAAYLGPLAELLDQPANGLAILFITPSARSPAMSSLR